MSEKAKRMAGRTIPFVMIIGIFIFMTFLILNRNVSDEFQYAKADTATTSVVVGNDAPFWIIDTQEVTPSASTSPTNSGDNVSWHAVADDPNGDNYYLLICSTSSAPTANNGAAPECAGGSTYRWGVSTNTATGTTSTVSYTTQESDPESNDWYAFVCDGNTGGALCSTNYQQGSSTTASPFAVNHRPILATISNDSPTDPGAVVTWSTNALTTDNDTFGGQDTVRLHICQTIGWNTSTQICLGAYYCSSTAVVSNPSCNYTIPSIRQDTTYAAFVYLVDGHGHVYSASASSSDYQVANVAPTVSAASINLLDTDGTGNLQLLPGYAATATPGFKVEATITDNNSCEVYGGGNEITTFTHAFVYRSGVGYGSCSTSTDADPNNCYYISGTCSIGPCSGPSDPDATTSCTFSLWFVAEPTYGSDATDTPWWNENWLATVVAVDDDGASSSTEGSAGNELDPMLAYTLLTTAIPYGTVAPGATSSVVTTTVQAIGNVGIDENLSGTDMQRQGGGATIPVGNQHYSTSSPFSYWSGGVTTTASAVELELNCPKSISTTTPTTSDTYWMILVPGAITTGVFNGTNTIAALTSEGQEW